MTHLWTTQNRRARNPCWGRYRSRRAIEFNIHVTLPLQKKKPKALPAKFSGMLRSRLALETGMHSPWVSRLLSELGHEVIVAHARNVRLMERAVEKMIAAMPARWPGWRESTRVCWGRYNTAVEKHKRI